MIRTSGMTGRVAGLLLILATAAAPRVATAQVFTTPKGEAENVRFEQVGAGTVHIFYDLVASDPRAVFLVTLDASQDRGSTFTVRPMSVSGDVGPGVTPGTGKRIVWESGRDVERLEIDQFRFRISAQAGPLELQKVDPPAAPAAPAAAPETPATAAKPPGTAPTTPAPQPQTAAAKPKSGGGATKWLLIGGGGAAAAGVAAASGGGSGGGSTPTANTPATTTPPANPVPGGVSDGSWAGSGRATSTIGTPAQVEITFRTVGGEIREWQFSWRIDTVAGNFCDGKARAANSQINPDRTFVVIDGGSTLHYDIEIRGSFTSATTASGTLQLRLKAAVLNPCGSATIPWVVTRQ